MILDNIPIAELERILEAFEYARDYSFDSHTSQQPALYAIKRQKISGLDINTYIYVADNYKELKEKVRRWKSRTQTSNSL
ncbi:hypothetical protein B5F09_06615 [Erysipelatoclostridium sp. An173]|uniref:hypothetical protein n=1 Tax=Erysipelatoclostridium sp. An173 TaxID=1965571 RepID=UPI000B388185|nr:hypothetical protein [Erysipelatoclostridium sp. An173]OUP77226.1 hypothetical protein B5F09_06615 [Erysipelatoclostridium sp. An173]